MAETTLFFGLLFLSIFISGSKGGNLVQEVGTDVNMQTEKPDFDFDDFYWMFNGKNVILFQNKKSVKEFGSFINRTEFNRDTYMLTLKNLKKADSGEYKTKASGDTNRFVTTHTLSVIDAVKTPKLICQPDENTCNIAVCEGLHSTISSNCTKENCETKEETSGDITLSLFMEGSTIICKQSNAVNWEYAERTLKKGEENAASGPYPRLPWSVLSAVLIVTQILNII